MFARPSAQCQRRRPFPGAAVLLVLRAPADMSPWWTRSAIGLALALALASCGPGGGGGDGDAGGRERTRRPGATSAPCPDGSTLTYDTFGRDFLSTYCVRCHASGLTTVAERGGAPIGMDFDTAELAREHRAAIDSVAAAGPTRVNVYMPIGTPQPTDEERELLGEWLACGAP